MQKILLLVGLILFSSIFGCSSSDSDSELDVVLRQIIADLNLSGDPAKDRVLPSIDEPIAQLGRVLFFSKSLGGDFDSACVTCHHPILGGGDGLPLPIGVGAQDPNLLGVGRVHESGFFNVPRNAPTTFNIGLWDSGLFWDSRVESLGKTPKVNGADGAGIRTPDSTFGIADSLAGSTMPVAQSRFPVTSAEEMRGKSFAAGASNAELRSALVDRLASDPNWIERFSVVFGTEEITFEQIAEAIGQYERSQVFVNTPWKAYVEGNNSAISSRAKRGAELFFKTKEEGGANCASCHSGDFFTDELFHSVASPQIGHGKGDGSTGTNDFGRARETGRSVDKFTFRTPSLLNVSTTGPFFHAGSFDSLAAVVRHHTDPKSSLADYNPSDIPQAKSEGFAENTAEMLSHLEANPSAVIDTFNAPLTFSEDDVSALVEFLETLTDPCVEDRQCVDSWIAKEEEDPDGNLLIAVDSSDATL